MGAAKIGETFFAFPRPRYQNVIGPVHREGLTWLSPWVGTVVAKSPDYRPDFRAGQLVLFGVAALVILLFVWTYVH